jgi:hypothetical protein
MITGSERSFSYTVENCLNLKLEAVVVFCFFVTSFFPEDLSRRAMAIGRPVIFLSVSGGVGYRAYPISVSVALTRVGS